MSFEKFFFFFSAFVYRAPDIMECEAWEIARGFGISRVHADAFSFVGVVQVHSFPTVHSGVWDTLKTYCIHLTPLDRVDHVVSFHIR